MHSLHLKVCLNIGKPQNPTKSDDPMIPGTGFSVAAVGMKNVPMPMTDPCMLMPYMVCHLPSIYPNGVPKMDGL